LTPAGRTWWSLRNTLTVSGLALGVIAGVRLPAWALP